MRYSKARFAILTTAVLAVCIGGYIYSQKMPSPDSIGVASGNSSILSPTRSRLRVLNTDMVNTSSHASHGSVPTNFANHPTQSPAVLSQYVAKVPDLQTIDDGNILYTNTLDTDERHLTYFKELSDKGNATAKMLYANRLSIPLLKRFYEELSSNGKVVNLEKWRSEFSDIQNLYVAAAASGNYMAAVHLSMVPPLQINDKEELLAWSIIADKMGSAGGQSLHRTCTMLREECTDAVLSNSTERALMYIDVYDIKKK